MRQESSRNLEKDISNRFGLPAPTVVSQFGQGRAFAMSRLSCDTFGHGPSAVAEAEDAYVLHVMLQDTQSYNLQLKGERVASGSAARDAVFLGRLRHQPVADFETPFDLVRIYVTQASLDEHGEPSRNGLPVTLRTQQQGASDPVLSHLLRTVLPVFGNVFDQGQLFVDSISLAIQDHLIRAYGSGADDRHGVSGGLPPWLERRAKEFIESRLAIGTSLDEIAKHCGLSPSHFSKGFRVSTGSPPHRWLLERRIELAKSLLREEDRPVSEVAQLCGFSDACHFSRMFSQLTREPPASWRRRNRS